MPGPRGYTASGNAQALHPQAPTALLYLMTERAEQDLPVGSKHSGIVLCHMRGLTEARVFCFNADDRERLPAEASPRPVAASCAARRALHRELGHQRSDFGTRNS
jgi:hypothetical protein